MAAIVSFISDLKMIIGLIQEVRAWLKVEQNKRFLLDVRETMESLKGSKTPIEKINAAIQIQKLITRL